MRNIPVAQKEVALVARYMHEHLVSIHSFFMASNDSQLWLVHDFMDRGTLPLVNRSPHCSIIPSTIWQPLPRCPLALVKRNCSPITAAFLCCTLQGHARIRCVPSSAQASPRRP